MNKIVCFVDKYTPPAPTTNATHWYHGTLSRSESDRAIRKHAKTYHENQVNTRWPLLPFTPSAIVHA